MSFCLDGKKCDNKYYVRKEEDGNLHPEYRREENVVLVREPQGDMITHFTQSTDKNSNLKPAEQLGKKVVVEMEKYTNKDNLICIKCDSTATNTGGDGGAVQYIEKLLDRPLYWGVCDIHTNELPLREGFKKYFKNVISITFDSAPP